MDGTISEQEPSHALNRVAVTAADNSTQRQISHTYTAPTVFSIAMCLTCNSLHAAPLYFDAAIATYEKRVGIVYT